MTPQIQGPSTIIIPKKLSASEFHALKLSVGDVALDMDLNLGERVRMIELKEWEKHPGFTYLGGAALYVRGAEVPQEVISVIGYCTQGRDQHVIHQRAKTYFSRADPPAALGIEVMDFSTGISRSVDYTDGRLHDIVVGVEQDSLKRWARNRERYLELQELLHKSE